MTNRKATALVTVLASTSALGLFLAKPPVLARAESGQAPKTIQIFPAGPDLELNDGRKFKMSDAAGLVERFNAAAQPVLVDYDHLSAFDVAEGGNSKAAGWIQKLEIRDGQVWALVEWTVTAAAAIEAREYRFISPEFTADKKTGEITGLLAAALVNRPAFTMTALAARKATGDDTMLKAIAKALGLKDEATEAEVLAAIGKKDGDHATALAAARNPKPDAFMPRADYDRVLARADAAEAKLAKADTDARATEIETVIAAAIKAGKIAPASKDHYVALCASADGFDQVKKLVETLPAVIETPELDDRTKTSGDDDPANLAARARKYQEDQARAGLTISTGEAVRAVKEQK